MKFNVLCLTVLMALSAGCHTALDPVGMAEDQNKIENLEKEGNDKIAEMNKSNSEVNASYGINLNPLLWMVTPTFADQFDWSKYSPTVRQTIRAKLQTQLSRVGRILEIASHKNITLIGSIENLKRVQQNAQWFKNSLDAYEGKPADRRAATDLEVLRSEGNSKIKEVNQNNVDLTTAYGINLNPLFTTTPTAELAEKFDWSKFSPSVLQKIRDKLNLQISHVIRIQEIAAHSGIILVGSVTELNTVKTNAQHYKTSLEKTL